ncbi:IS110 family transposase [Pontibacter sp. G13]|uniref:IS110 family transposase n=1 Tax=Pontibacter sp. G13 TaxID=3074898 RepID=UPI0028892306|nr:IS110 family transposase [Pontibacter sp. G13]WNJ20059.1 IS110 family transposase [Pontibacter sp. G13]
MEAFCGIDVSKSSFHADYSGNELGTREFKNKPSDFRKLVKWAPEGVKFVMESTGPYHNRLATFLFEAGYEVFVVNPLIIKRFSEAILSRAKTDSRDARIIVEYAESRNFKLLPWKPRSRASTRMQQILRAMHSYEKQLTMNKNRKGANQDFGTEDPMVARSLKSIIGHLKREIKKLEKELERIANEEFGTEMELLQSIKGIGPKTASLLVHATDGFTRFENVKQLVAYAGLSPTISQSGTSLNRRGKICKKGNGALRRNLYMGAFSAIKYNKPCNQLFERLMEQGKHYQKARVAVACKLLRQAFGVVTRGEKFNPDFHPKTCF